MTMPKPQPVTASIVLNESPPFAIGDTVTFTTVVPKLKGSAYPLVYLKATVDGEVVYGQLDYPSAAFLLGGGSSPWIDPANPHYRQPAICVAELWAYGGPKGEQRLASTEEFPAG